ncbi:hypothetical protein ACLMAB_05965 [Brevibacillus laterosporus]
MTKMMRKLTKRSDQKALTEREIYLEEKKNKKEAPKVQKKGFDTKGSSATKKTVISDDDLPF